MHTLIERSFPKLTIAPPLFYKWPSGLRFAIGDPHLPIWKDEERRELNPRYFEVALHRAKTIFEQVFEEHHELSIVYQQFSDGRSRISKRNLIFRYIHDDAKVHFRYSRVRRLPGCSRKQYHWNRLCVFPLTRRNFNYQDLLEACLCTDFGSRGRSFRGDCYLFHHQHRLLFHLYDDRGLDIVSPSKDVLQELYREFNDWLLDYDRNYMDALFEK